MSMNLDWNLISIVVFYSLIALFLFIRRKRGEVQSKITEAIKSLLPKEFIVSGYAIVNEAFSDEFEKALYEFKSNLQAI